MGRRRHILFSGCALLYLIQLWLLVVRVSAQPGFISIDCGGTDPYQDAAGIQWNPDSASWLPNLNVTESAGVQLDGNQLERAMWTLRYFPAESAPIKSCFVLNVTPSNVYLVRAGFFYGNYDGVESVDIQFQISLESTVWHNIAGNSSSSPLYIEAITPSLQSSELNVCLIRTRNTSSPFINSLELRPLGSSMYQSSDPSLGFEKIVNFYLVQRVNFGERRKTVRYPDDVYDRRWPPYLELYPDLEGVVKNIKKSSSMNFTIDDTSRDQPPVTVMQTAITAPDFNYSYTQGIIPGNTYAMSMFYAELEATLQPNDRRIIQIVPTYYANGYVDTLNLTSVGLPFTAVQWGSTRTLSSASVTTRITRDPSSTLDPIINADELYHVVTCDLGTNSYDVEALKRLKEALVLRQWTGDPCLPASWNEVQCSSDKRVTSLNLSRHSLNGQIPADDIAGLEALRSVDLSGNTFSGPFPYLATLTNLQTLNLSNNQLTGAFPDWVSTLEFLAVLDVSNNDLSGVFPDSLTRLGENFRYSGNPLLTCSGAACPPSALPGSKKNNSSIGPIIGGLAGAIVFILIFVGIMICCFKRYKAEKLRPSSNVRGGAAAMGSVPIKPAIAPEHMKLPVREEAQHYTLSSVQTATNNFSKTIGDSSSVFFGVLPGGRQVVVKKVSASSYYSLRESESEIALLATIHHTNLVSLVGYCRESSELILVYDYMVGGDLKRRLYGPNAPSDLLSWKARLQIAVDAARGLEYLHYGCNPSIVHRGLTSSDILLTNKLEAKVSDFGLSKLTDGTVGNVSYLDPEYHQTGLLSEKSDVYSYGVILLEIMCGQPPIPPEGSRLASNQGPLTDRVRSAMDAGNLDRIIDPFLGGKYQPKSARKFAETAMSCLRVSGSKRPTMTQIISGLLQALDMESADPTASRSNFTGTRSPLDVEPGYSNLSTGLDSSYLADDMPSQIFRTSEQPVPR